MADKELVIRINASAKGFQAELSKMEAQTKELEKSLKSVAKVSGAAFIALTAAITGSVVAFTQFENKFTNVVTLLDKSSFKTKTLTEGIDDLKRGVIALGGETGETFDNLNQGLFDLISAGVPAEEAINTLRIATDLAAAGATDTAIAVDGLTSAMNAYELGADQAQKVSEKFFTAQKFGKTNIEELASGFGLVGTSAASLGVDLNELLAAVSAATTGGIRTKAAYTGLTAVFANIAKPTKEARLEAKKLGVEFSAQALEAKGLKKFLDDITKANGFNKQSALDLFGSVEAVKTIFALTGSAADDFTNILAELNDEQTSAITFSEALAVKNATAAKAFSKAKVAAEAVAIVIGEQFAPFLKEAADILTSLAKTISEFDQDTLKLIASIIGVAASLAGLITALSLGALAFLKIRAGLAAFNALIPGTKITLAGLKVAFTSTWAAATLGISLIIALLPEAIALFSDWKKQADDVAKSNEKLKTIFAKDVQQLGEAITKRRALQAVISKSQKEIDRLSSSNVLSDKFQVEALKARQKEQLKSLDLINREITGLELQREAFRKKIKDQKEAAKIEKEESESPSQISPLTDEEIQAAEKRKQFEFEFQKDLQKIKEEFRESDIQKFIDNFKTEEELADEAFQRRIEKEIERKNELNDLSRTIDEEIAQEKHEKEVARRSQFLKDEKKFGKTFANLRKLLSSDEIQAANFVTGKLSELMRSRNKTLFEIGKAAALANIAIDTAQGAQKAYAQFGYPFGIAAAGAVIAVGALRLSEVRGTDFKAQDGGIVPQKQGGLRDRVNVALEPGELVTPKALVPNFIQAIGRGGDSEDEDNLGIESSKGGNVFQLIIETLIAENDEAVAELFQKFREFQEFNNVAPLTV